MMKLEISLVAGGLNSTHFHDRWDPYEEPTWRDPLFFYKSGFFQGEVASYKFHFVETEWDYNCP